MTLFSLPFLVAVLAVLPVYWALPARTRPAWLFALSTAFVIAWSWDLAAVLLVVATVNFQIGRWLGRAEKGRGALLVIGIGFDLLVLAALKYSSFYSEALSGLLARLGLAAADGGLALLAPVGLSFLVVQMVSYLVDVSKRLIGPEASWLSFCLYALYFPKLISGPVERLRRLMPLLKEPIRPDAAALERSLWLIVLGAIRKRVLADGLMALLPAGAFQAPWEWPGPNLFIYLLAYAFAIYNDFAGYSAIARGVSGLFGVELTVNFRLPYFARNFNEFWDRWHISLSTWLRDYIFFPLSRALLKRVPRREHPLNLIVPPLATLLVSGLWHGLGWNFLLWGGLHGLYLLGERLLTLRAPRRLPGQAPAGRQFLSALAVFGLVLLAWLPFRMEPATAWSYLYQMLRSVNWLRLLASLLAQKLAGGLAWDSWPGLASLDLRAFVLILPGLLLDALQARRDEEHFPMRWSPWVRAAFLAVAALALALLAFSGASAPFIYQGF